MMSGLLYTCNDTDLEETESYGDEARFEEESKSEDEPTKDYVFVK